MRASSLREEYRQAFAAPLNVSEIESENGMHHILYRSDWVRIVLVRKLHDSDSTIEVELSIPEKEISNPQSAVHIIHRLITHLHYLLGLHDIGFGIEIMEDDVCWTASIEISNEPELEFFEGLLPPET